MPTLFRACLVLLISVFAFSGNCLASSDPQYATPSATATVPSQAEEDDDDAPSIPILIRPTDGTVTADPKPEFVWKQSTDPNGNTVIYTLYLDGVAKFLGISNLGNSAGTGYTARIEGSEVRLLPTSPLADKSYLWYVTASDLAGNTSRSATWSLTIDTTPSPLTLVDLDSYHLPTITEGANFDITGPKDVYFTLLTDPFATLQITLTPVSDHLPPTVFTLQGTASAAGLTYLYQHLVPGVYEASILALDRARNSTFLPDFTITIHQATFTIDLPGVPLITLPYSPPSLPSLPATISKITSRDQLPYIIVGLLALAILILLILIWHRRVNLYLLDISGQPIKEALIYHSIPDTRSHFSQVYLARHAPVSFDLLATDHGKIFIPGLTRYSTLTIRIKDATYILSLCTKRKLYALTLG